MKDARSFYIDGGWVSPLAGTDHPEIDPSTEEHFATVSLGGPMGAGGISRNQGCGRLVR